VARRREEEVELHVTTPAPILRTTLFAELGGYVVLDVAGTRACWVPPQAQLPVDLLAKLAAPEEVERVAAREALLPLVLDEPDDCVISILLGDASLPPFDAALGDEAGWSLRAEAEGQQLLGIGHLLRWGAHDTPLASFHLPVARYAVRCRWGLRAGRRCIDLVFVPAPSAAEPGTAREFPIAVTFLAGPA
jgi:hypothetical protein